MCSGVISAPGVAITCAGQRIHQRGSVAGFTYDHDQLAVALPRNMRLSFQAARSIG